MSLLEHDLDKACWPIRFVLICPMVVIIFWKLLLVPLVTFSSRLASGKVGSKARSSLTQYFNYCRTFFACLCNFAYLIIVSLGALGSCICIPHVVKSVVQAIADCGTYLGYPPHWPFVLALIVLCVGFGFRIWCWYSRFLDSHEQRTHGRAPEPVQSDQNASTDSDDEPTGGHQAMLHNSFNPAEHTVNAGNAPPQWRDSPDQHLPPMQPTNSSEISRQGTPATPRLQRQPQHMKAARAEVPRSTPTEDRSRPQSRKDGKLGDVDAVPRKTETNAMSTSATPRTAPTASSTPPLPSSTAASASSTRTLRPRTTRQIQPFAEEREEFRRKMKDGKQHDIDAVPARKKSKVQSKRPSVDHDSGVDLDSDSPDDTHAILPANRHLTVPSLIMDGSPAEQSSSHGQDRTWKVDQPVIFQNSRKSTNRAWNESTPIVFGGEAGPARRAFRGTVKEVKWRDVSPTMSGAV